MLKSGWKEKLLGRNLVVFGVRFDGRTGYVVVGRVCESITPLITYMNTTDVYIKKRGECIIVTFHP